MFVLIVDDNGIYRSGARCSMCKVGLTAYMYAAPLPNGSPAPITPCTGSSCHHPRPGVAREVHHDTCFELLTKPKEKRAQLKALGAAPTNPGERRSIYGRMITSVERWLGENSKLAPSNFLYRF